MENYELIESLLKKKSKSRFEKIRMKIQENESKGESNESQKNSVGESKSETVKKIISKSNIIDHE